MIAVFCHKVKPIGAVNTVETESNNRKMRAPASKGKKKTQEEGQAGSSGAQEQDIGAKTGARQPLMGSIELVDQTGAPARFSFKDSLKEYVAGTENCLNPACTRLYF